MLSIGLPIVIGVGIYAAIYADSLFKSHLQSFAEKINKPISIEGRNFQVGHLSIAKMKIGKNLATIRDIKISLNMNPFNPEFLGLKQIDIRDVSAILPQKTVSLIKSTFSKKTILSEASLTSRKFFQQLSIDKFDLKILGTQHHMQGHQLFFSGAEKKYAQFRNGKITLNGHNIQVESFFAQKHPKTREVHFNLAGSIDKTNTLELKGKVDRKTQRLTGRLQLNSLPLEVLEFFGSNGISLDNTHLTTSLLVQKDPQAVRFILKPAFNDLTVSSAALSDAPVGPIPVSGTIIGRLTNTGKLKIKNSHLQSSSWPKSPKNSKNITIHLSSHSDLKNKTHSFSLVVPKTSCENALEAIPYSSATTLPGIKMKGDLSANLEITKALHDNQQFYLKKIDFSCTPTEVPVHMSRDALIAKSPSDFAENVSPRFFLAQRSNQLFVPLERIAPHFKKMVINSEDGSFYRHGGVVWKQLERSINRNIERSSFAFGGSTITMQLARNLYLSAKKNVSRKLQEIIIAKVLEKEYSKKEQLASYLNMIEFGPGVHGVAAASKHFFATTPNKLTPLQSSFLASLIPAPSTRYISYCEKKLGDTMKSLMKQKILRLRSENAISYFSAKKALSMPLSLSSPTGLSSATCVNVAKKARTKVKDREKIF